MLMLGISERDISESLENVCFESLKQGKFGVIGGEYLITAASCANSSTIGEFRVTSDLRQTYEDILVPKCGNYYEICPTWTERRFYGRIMERHIVADKTWLQKTNIYQNSELYWSDTNTPLDEVTNNFLALSTVGSTFDFFGEVFEVVSQPIFNKDGLCSFNYTRTKIQGIHIFSLPYDRITR